MERYDGKTEEQVKREARIRNILIFLAIIAVIAVGVFLSRLDPAPELNIVLAFEGSISAEAKELFEEAVSQTDVAVSVQYLIFDPAFDEEEFSALQLRISADENCLFILSDQPKSVIGGWFPGLSTLFCENEYFDDINSVGGVFSDGNPDFEFDEGTEFYSRVQVNETPLFEAMGLSDIEFYASVADWTESGGSLEALEAATQIIHDVLDYKG